MNQQSSLHGKVALVTGASRGIGKGIALALGEAGATVYVTARSLDKGQATVPLPGTLQETVEAIHQAGGVAVAVQCDHYQDNEVRHVFETIKTDQGKLDILVNNAWSGYQMLQRKESGFLTKFWKHKNPEAFWDAMFDVGVRSHYVASAYAADMMVKQGSGLIVHITAAAGFHYSSSVAYGVSKASVNRMAADMAHELRQHHVAVVSLCPGRTKTEMILSHKGSTTYNESPHFVGRSILALATDPNVLEKSGQTLITRQLATEYGFTDVDGTRPSMEKGF